MSRSTNMRTATLLALAALACSCVCWMGATHRADAATGGPLYSINVREDSFLNYDFLPSPFNLPPYASRNNVDWAISFVFFGNASINKVKSKLNWAMRYSGSRMHAKVNNGSGWVWDQDGGIKTHLCPSYGQTAVHMRLYAPPSTDTLWNRDWGYYIIGSSHNDHQECWATGKWFGNSEPTEHWIANRARETWGSWRVNEDSRNFWNARYALDRYGRQVNYCEGNHCWLNNGLATTIHVP